MRSASTFAFPPPPNQLANEPSVPSDSDPRHLLVARLAPYLSGFAGNSFAHLEPTVKTSDEFPRRTDAQRSKRSAGALLNVYGTEFTRVLAEKGNAESVLASLRTSRERSQERYAARQALRNEQEFALDEMVTRLSSRLELLSVQSQGVMMDVMGTERLLAQDPWMEDWDGGLSSLATTSEVEEVPAPPAPATPAAVVTPVRPSAGPSSAFAGPSSAVAGPSRGPRVLVPSSQTSDTPSRPHPRPKYAQPKASGSGSK